MKHDRVTPETSSSIAGLAFALALVGYGLLTALTARPTSIDALASVVTGTAASGWDVSYAFVLSQAHAVAGLLGGSVFGTATALSVLGGAVSVAAVAAAVQEFGRTRRDAALASAMVGSCPAVVGCATQPGSPVLGLACAALALTALTRWLRTRSSGSGAALTGFAVLGVVLDQGSLVLPLALAAAWFTGGPGERAPLPGAALFTVLAVLAAVWLSEPCREVIAKGWLRGYLPLSALWVMALARPASRGAAGVLGVALLAAVGAAAQRATEVRTDGGALLCLVVPLALLALRVASPAMLRAAIVLGLILGVARVASEDQSGEIDGLARGLRQVMAERTSARLIVRDERERGLALAGAEDIECSTVEALVTSFEVAAEREFYTQPIEDVLEAGMIDLLQKGHRVYLTQGAEDLLRDLPYRVRHHVAVRVFDHLRARFSLPQVEAAGFRAKEITLR